jgi:hypothetical protein
VGSHAHASTHGRLAPGTLKDESEVGTEQRTASRNLMRINDQFSRSLIFTLTIFAACQPFTEIKIDSIA